MTLIQRIQRRRRITATITGRRIVTIVDEAGKLYDVTGIEHGDDRSTIVIGRVERECEG